MRRLDETPIDPEVAASLDAIDATLAGEPVDPRHADLAELALLLAAERPQMRPQFASELDQRVARRFAAPAPAARPGRWLWLWTPAVGLATAATVAVVIVLSGGGVGSSSSSSTASGAVGVPAAKSAPHRTSSSAASAGATSTPQLVTQPAFSQSLSASGTLLQPAPNGRKIIQGAQLALTAASGRIDTVAQEVFDVIGQENGIVKGSTVTSAAGPNAYAQFELSVPSSNLARTMASLSTLRYAHVSSRTDTTQDVNDQYGRDVRALADARALRTSLLKQLANATTQAQIDSLNARIHDAEASISSDEATLRALQGQINFSQITLTINAPYPVPVSSHHSGGFTLHKAAHDAGRVLTVAAGVALIALAALVPVALLGALGWWIANTIRRRRREQALDLV
jgi:hypothetical protein